MKTHTYDEVMKKASAYGLLDTMSKADRALTQSNPDAGMTVLQSRYDYQNATTDDARALAHAVAERTRQQYGGYSGGVDGSQYYITEKSPGNFTYDDAPTYDDPYAEQADALLEKVTNREKYTSAYDDTQQQLMKDIRQTADYTYDPAADDLYSAYAKEYRREGQRAAADALGQAASLTGGIPSSAAQTAASQTQQYYATQLSDKISELAAAAYSRNADRQTMLLNALSAAQTADNTDYQRYLDDVALDYDNIETLRALRNDDYVKYRDELSQYNTDRDRAYDQLVDDLEYQQNLALNEASRADAAEATKNEELWNAALYSLEYFDDASLLKSLIKKIKENS